MADVFHPTPRSFSLETTWDLRAPLKSLGVRALFDPDAADFTPLSGKGGVGRPWVGVGRTQASWGHPTPTRAPHPSAEEPLVLGQALQKVRMEVTENGTEVASATGE